VSLGPEAVRLLEAVGGKERKGRVFRYAGRPITGTFNTAAFRKARRRAGLAGVRWHDLRHTFASWLASEGASDRVLQAMGGWTSPRMVARYAHLRAGDLRPWAELIGKRAPKLGNGEKE
jgi:integrase